VPIVRDARNPRIQPGTAGYFDASTAVAPLEVPTGVVDRSLGDVHPEGNPHYLLDPVRAKAVAKALADALERLDPARAGRWREGAEAFARRADEAMFGKDLLEAVPVKRLERLLARGELGEWLKSKGLEGKAGGWARTMVPLAGTRFVAYHGYFTYLADRFHLETVAYLEPKPGVPPSPRHLRTVVESMKARSVPAILCTVFNPRDVAEAVAKETGARVEVLAHMPGALGEDADYFSCVDRNVRLLAASLGGTR
jgi:ABC-type Zn uptake system ZnuABC Zn-binding protein ZnuA